MLFTDFSRVVFFKIYLSPLRMLQALVFFAEDIGDRLGGKDIINKTGDGSTDSSCSLYFLVQMYKLWLLLICGKRKLINQLLILAHCLLALLRIIYQLSVAWVRWNNSDYLFDVLANYNRTNDALQLICAAHNSASIVLDWATCCHNTLQFHPMQPELFRSY